MEPPSESLITSTQSSRNCLYRWLHSIKYLQEWNARTDTPMSFPVSQYTASHNPHTSHAHTLTAPRSRVSLPLLLNNPASDYINANYMRVCDTPPNTSLYMYTGLQRLPSSVHCHPHTIIVHAYRATKAPLVSTLPPRDHWTTLRKTSGEWCGRTGLKSSSWPPTSRRGEL